MRTPWAKREPLPQLYICELMRRLHKHSRRRRPRANRYLSRVRLDWSTLQIAPHNEVLNPSPPGRYGSQWAGTIHMELTEYSAENLARGFMGNGF